MKNQADQTSGKQPAAQSAAFASTPVNTSDQRMLELIRRSGPRSISDFEKTLNVTKTAVRQRITRLSAQGFIERQAEKSGRGRPAYRYELTLKGQRTAGNNYADLASTLWQEIRSISEPSIRKNLLKRIAERLADNYRTAIQGKSDGERLESLVDLLKERGIACEIDTKGELPILSAYSCPYPELAELDRSICAMEKMLFSEVIGSNVRLTECRLDGDFCCTFTGTPT